MSDTVKFFALLVLILALIVIGPLLTIWALNTLFATGIEYTLTNWAAVVILGMFLQARVTKS